MLAEARLAAAVAARGESVPSEPSLGQLSPAGLVPTAGSTTTSSHVLGRPARRSRTLLAAAVAIVLLAGTVLLGYGLLGTPAAAPTTATAREQIAVGIGSGVRVVLVDGVRHAERPVLVAVPPGGAEVTLIAEDGSEHRQRVSSQDHGRLLALPLVATATAPAAVSAPAGPPSVSTAAPPVRSSPGAAPPKGHGSAAPRPGLIVSPY
jgi:hypothetical protein